MCVNPYRTSYTDFTGRVRQVDAPCGKCVECIIDIQNSWKLRLIEEDKNWKLCYFFTLTYRDSALPHYVDRDTGELLSTALKSDIQSWLKRFRTNYYRVRAREMGVKIGDLRDLVEYDKYKPRFKYFICAEYGPNGTHRPHYHGLLFTDIPARYMCQLWKDWRFRCGFVNVKRIRGNNKSLNRSSAAANYCSKYCCKGEFDSRRADIESGKIEKAFRLMSKNIGSSYVTPDRIAYHKPTLIEARSHGYQTKAELAYSRLFYYDGDYKYKLPRYYRQKIFYTVISKEKLFYDFQKKTWSFRPVKRYAVRTLLPLQMLDYQQLRIDERYRERFKQLQSAYPAYSDTEIDLLIFGERSRMEAARSSRSRGKLNKFYFENKLKNKYL